MSKLTRKSSVSMSDEIEECATLRALALGYTSRSAYIVGLIRADIAIGLSHELSLKIAEMGIRGREKIDAEILTKARGNRGSVAIDSEELEADKVVSFAPPRSSPPWPAIRA